MQISHLFIFKNVNFPQILFDKSTTNHICKFIICPFMWFVNIQLASSLLFLSSFKALNQKPHKPNKAGKNISL